MINFKNILQEYLTEAFYGRTNNFNMDNIKEISYYKKFEEPDPDDPDDEGYWYYELELIDKYDDRHYVDCDGYDELENLLGETNAQYIRDSKNDKGCFDIEPDTSVSDLNNVNEVNAVAKKLFPVQEYYSGERGYILTDGSFISFGPNTDHISITNIDGMTIGRFVSLGNIRVGESSFYLEKPPTAAQKQQLYKLIGGSNDNVYIDIVKWDGKSQYSANLDGVTFPKGSSPKSVLNQIERFFNEGTKMSPYEVDYMDESTKKLNKWLNETKKWMGILVENGDILYTDKLLTESQESKSIDAAKKLVIQRLNYTPEQADEFVRVTMRHSFPFFSRNKKGNKFILGVTRMYIDGQLQDAQTINRINTTLKYVASDAHYNEYDRNLNGISAQDLIQRFAKNVEMDMENDRNEVNSMQFEGQSQYDIVRIDSFEQACEYNRYTYKDSPWCLTYSKSNYDSYSCNGVNQIYFCLRKGFESVEPVPGEGCPLDVYGLSMISIIVNENGALAYCTSRWNHANGGNDNVMDTKQISEVIGMNFYNVFKPNNKWKESLDNAMQRLRNGENPEDVFDECEEFNEGFIGVILNGKCNFIKEDGSLLSPDLWFDECSDFNEGFTVVVLNGKCNLLSRYGNFVWDKPFEQWFDECYYFHNGFAIVILNEKYNFIRKDGRLLWDKPFEQWFDECWGFYNGFAKVELNGKENLLKSDGCLLSTDQWFNWCDGFYEGFAKVELNGKDYYIDIEGNMYDEKTKKPLGINVNNKKQMKQFYMDFFNSIDPDGIL